MKRYNILWTCLLTVFLIACEKEYKAPVPYTRWDLFESSSNRPLQNSTRNAMEGMYHITEGSPVFGNDVALKWSYLANGNDTTFYLSGFFEKDVMYFICEGKRSDSTLLFNGYWRKMINTETGLVRFIVHSKYGASQLTGSTPVIGADSIIMDGRFGNDGQVPDKPLLLHYSNPFKKDTSFQIIAHRCGGRTSDLLPVAENSIGMVKMAARMGATGVEMDVRLTSDAVPIIYHDEKLSDRLIQPNGMLGEISNYSYNQLYDLVRLPDNERIPTLREILETIVYDTPLTMVWLDIKFNAPLQLIREMQIEFEQKAAANHRILKILIGIPEEAVRDNFLKLEDYRQSECVSEMYEDVDKVNAYAWGARWTEGTQDEKVQEMHGKGKKAFVWTIDVPEFARQYINEAHYDALLSNYPSLIAYYHYAKK